MAEPHGLDRWSDKKEGSDRFAKSLFPSERITLHSLKERILELEQMRDQIQYELDRLKTLTKNRQCEG